MATTAGAIVQAHPSFTEPDALIVMEQVSGYSEILGGGAPRVKISTEDQYVYMNVFDIRGNVIGSQNSTNTLPGCAITQQQISTPTYLMQASSQWNGHEAAAFGQFGHSIVEAERLGNRQGFAQALRNWGLYGYNAANGEGLVNTAGAYSTTLPADTFGNTTVRTYDNGQMAQYMLTQAVNVKIRMQQLGYGPNEVVILGPQRILGLWAASIVQLTEAQRPGAGLLTTAQTFDVVAKEWGDAVAWAYDDTLIGQGAGGADLVIVAVPEFKIPKGRTTLDNTNQFATLAPNMRLTTVQYVDMAAPKEITVPLSRGATDVTYELKATSGWGLRGEGLALLSMTY